MAQHAVVVTGASAGGLQALRSIVERLPVPLSDCVFGVVHASANGQGILPQILARVTPLPIGLAAEGAPIDPGRALSPAPIFTRSSTTAA